MTEYIKLRKADFPMMRKGRVCTEPLLIVRKSGLIILNRMAVKLLGVEKAGVSFCAEKSARNCFAIMRDVSAEGFRLRYLKSGEWALNNAPLARHLMEGAFSRMGVPAGTEMPCKMFFRVALKPVDDDKNNHVFALIHKK